MGWSAARFWAATPAEVEAGIRHANIREDRAWDKVAWLLAHLLGSLTGKDQDMRKLRPARAITKRKHRSRDEARAELEDLKTRIG